MKQDKNQNANLKTRNLHWAAWKTTLEEKTDKKVCVWKTTENYVWSMITLIFFINFKFIVFTRNQYFPSDA